MVRLYGCAGSGHDGEHPAYSEQQQLTGEEKVSNSCTRSRTLIQAFYCQPPRYHAVLVAIPSPLEGAVKSTNHWTMNAATVFLLSLQLMQMKAGLIRPQNTTSSCQRPCEIRQQMER